MLKTTRATVLFAGALILGLIASPSCQRYAASGRPGATPAPGATAAPGATGTREAPAAASSIDGPEISRSFGDENGVLLLWPRIVGPGSPASSRALAGELQAWMHRFLQETFPDRAIEVRPEPERVCPQAGCRAPTVGILLLQEEDGCAVLALVSAPGRSPSQLLPWVGDVRVGQSSVPFRESPEAHVTVQDFAPCGEVMQRVEEGRPSLEPVLRSLVR